MPKLHASSASRQLERVCGLLVSFYPSEPFSYQYLFQFPRTRPRALSEFQGALEVLVGEVGLSRLGSREQEPLLQLDTCRHASRETHLSGREMCEFVIGSLLTYTFIKANFLFRS